MKSVLRWFALGLALLPGSAWAVPATAVLALVGSGAAAAVTLTEPTLTEDGALLTLPGNKLTACAYWLNGTDTTYWLRATRPGGGGIFPISTPTLVSELPVRYEAACLNAQGWSESAMGTLGLTFTEP